MPQRAPRRRTRENAAFLAALAQTGNARLAARTLGVHRAAYTKRRAKDPAFAAAWDAALAAAQARLAKGQSLVTVPTSTRTRGGEPVLVRLKSGRLQLRLAPPGRMTRAGEAAFLRALSASANVRLSAAAAGFAHSTFYGRARRDRAFAREKRLALEMGYTRLEATLLAAFDPASGEHDEWRRNDPPPIAPMTPAQALQLLYLHEKSVRQSWEQPHRRKRRGESWDTYTERLRAMWTAEQARAAEDEAVAEALRAAPDWPDDDDPPPPTDVALDQVTGWSKADPTKVPYDPDLAMFGGKRIGRRPKRPPS